MKTLKVIAIFSFFMLISVCSYSQWVTNGNNIYYNNGNVGIGTNYPAHKLHVMGNVVLPNGSSYWLGNVDNTGNRLRMHYSGEDAYIDYYPRLFLRTNDSNNNLKYAFLFTKEGYWGIGDNNPRSFLDINNGSSNSLKAVLARLGEGDNAGEGTYLGVKSYVTQPAVIGSPAIDVKSFAIEHKFFGELNNAINFYRGLGTTGGEIRIAVNNGYEMCKFNADGMDLRGTIRAKEMKVELNFWPDYVFGSSYDLPSLKDVELHIQTYKHLPGIPSQTEVEANGIDLGTMNAMLLQKIEELTLYVIKQQNIIDDQQMQINQIKELISK